jgi:GAF domain-containing protein
VAELAAGGLLSRRRSRAVNQRLWVPRIPDRTSVVTYALLRSLVTVPLMAKEAVIGDLSVAQRTRLLPARACRVDQTVANHLAIAIENARLFEETRRSAREVEACSRANERMHPISGHAGRLLRDR